MDIFPVPSTDKHNATNKITIHNIVITCRRDAKGKDGKEGAPLCFYFVPSTACMRRRFCGLSNRNKPSYVYCIDILWANTFASKLFDSVCFH